MFREAPTPPAPATASGTAVAVPAARRPPRRAHEVPLPQLADDAALLAWVERQLAHYRRHGGRLALLLIEPAVLPPPALAAHLVDLVGQRLRARVRADDLVMRVGDHRFAVLLQHAGLAQAAIVHARLALALRGPYVLEGRSVECTLRLGHASYPDGAGHAAALLATAMHAGAHERRG